MAAEKVRVIRGSEDDDGGVYVFGSAGGGGGGGGYGGGPGGAKKPEKEYEPVHYGRWVIVAGIVTWQVRRKIGHHKPTKIDMK